MVHIWVRGKVSEKSILYSLVKILDYLLPPCVEQPIVPHSNQVFLLMTSHIAIVYCPTGCMRFRTIQVYVVYTGTEHEDFIYNTSLVDKQVLQLNCKVNGVHYILSK